MQSLPAGISKSRSMSAVAPKQFVSADTNAAEPEAVSAARKVATALLREDSARESGTEDDEGGDDPDLDFGTESEGSGSDEEVQQVHPPPAPPLLVVVVPALPKGEEEEKKQSKVNRFRIIVA